MLVAMAAIFVVALTIPESWRDMPGGLNGPLMFVCAYVLVRVVHLIVYVAAAGADVGLRHQLAITWLPMLAGAALLFSGALLGGWLQTLMFALALLVDWAGTYATSRGGSWRLHSPSHWVERHGLFIILAIGESVVAIGVGAARKPISGPITVGAVLGVAAAVCLWWLYFDVVSVAGERRFAELPEAVRANMALEAYTFGHFPIVAGVVLVALGIEGVLEHAAELKPLGGFYAAALFGGFLAYLFGHLVFKYRMHRDVSVPRLVAMLVLLLALPAGAFAPPLVALTMAVLIVAVLAGYEAHHYAPLRRQLHHA